MFFGWCDFMNKLALFFILTIYSCFAVSGNDQLYKKARALADEKKYQEAISKIDTIDQSLWRSQEYQLVVQSYRMLGEFDEALNFTSQWWSKYNNSEAKRNEAMCCLGYSRVLYNELKRPDALEYLKRADDCLEALMRATEKEGIEYTDRDKKRMYFTMAKVKHAYAILSRFFNNEADICPDLEQAIEWYDAGFRKLRGWAEAEIKYFTPLVIDFWNARVYLDSLSPERDQKRESLIEGHYVWEHMKGFIPEEFDEEVCEEKKKDSLGRLFSCYFQSKARLYAYEKTDDSWDEDAKNYVWEHMKGFIPEEFFR